MEALPPAGIPVPGGLASNLGTGRMTTGTRSGGLIEVIEKVTERHVGAGELIGNSNGLAEVLADVQRLLGLPINVLIEGESGTGKELLARSLHFDDPSRKSGRFVALNCAALPEQLLEAELFGHRKGLFTGADRDRDGLIRRADGGTLFLDEVSELPLSLQPKLLRVLQERAVRPLGHSAELPVDIRVISAANRPLRSCIEAGQFRSDLLYRLAEFELCVPPLRERRDDILPLARHFLAQFSHQFGKRGLLSLSSDAAALLQSRDWAENNVRELSVALKRAVLRCDGPVLQPGHLLADEPRVPVLPLGSQLQKLERDHLEAALKKSAGNISEAARLLGMKRSTLFDRLRKLGIRNP